MIGGADTEPKSNLAGNDSTRNDMNGDAPEASEDRSNVKGAEQKVA